LDAAIHDELQKRVRGLRSAPFSELAQLPQSQSERSEVHSQPVTFTTFRHVHANGEVMVLVRSDRSILFGLGSSGTTEGFWTTPNGEQRDALFEEIEDVFG
jgi:hypothetical protein